MAKDRAVQPHDVKEKDILRRPAAMALFGFLLAVGASGIWHLWNLTSGVPFWTQVEAFGLLMGCLAVNGVLAWVITESWKIDEGTPS